MLSFLENHKNSDLVLLSLVVIKSLVTMISDFWIQLGNWAFNVQSNLIKLVIFNILFQTIPKELIQENLTVFCYYVDCGLKSGDINEICEASSFLL